MIQQNGEFKVLEYNVRFCDSEFQVHMCELLYRAADGKLDGMQVEWLDEKTLSPPSRDYIRYRPCGRADI